MAAQDEVPCLFLQLLPHARSRVDTLVLDGKSRLTEVLHEQSRIAGRVFEDEDA
jgi:hypothetical protein